MLKQPMPQPAMEFGPCLKQILKQRRVSASELARMMAYKSRNSIFRILDGVGGHSARQAFFDKLLSDDPLGLSEEEREQLTQALEISRVGAAAFLSNQAMREMLLNAGIKPEGQQVRIEAYGETDDPDFSKTLASVERGKQAYITITGCCDRAIFNALHERVFSDDVTCSVKIVHFVYTGEEEIIQNISAIQPMLYCDCYTAYCIEPGMLSKERERLYRNNCIYMHSQDEHGEWHDQTLLLVDKGVFAPMRERLAQEEDPFLAFFRKDIPQMQLLKTVFAPGGLENYLDYTEDCRQLEQNRAIYTIKLDVPLSFIHPDILLPCVTEGFEKTGLVRGEALTALMAELKRIHLARWENYFTKRKESHTIFSRAAMQSFARTGMQSDHFFAIRPYTPQERVIILEHLRKEAQDNPYFHIHFFKEGFMPPTTELGLYEGVGTLLSKPYTHYDLCGDHAETVITQEAFCTRYKEFYMQDLLERHVVSGEEALGILDELIEIAKCA